MNPLLEKVLLILICIFYFYPTKAQESIPEARLLGDQLKEKAYKFYAAGDIDSVLFYCDQAAQQYKKAKAWPFYISILNDISQVNYSSKRYAEFSEVVDKAYQQSLIYLPEDSHHRIIALDNIETYFYSLGDYEKAIKISKEVLLLNEKNNIPKLGNANTNLNIGNSYKFSGDCQNALAYINKALEIQKDTIPNAPDVADTYQSVGLVYEQLGQLDSVIFYFEKAEKLLKPVEVKSKFIRRKIDNYLDIAGFWTQKKEFQKSVDYLDKAAALPMNEYYQVKYQEVLGKLFFEKSEFYKSTEAFLKAQSIADEFNKRNTPPLKAKRLLQLAATYKANEDINNALIACQKGVMALSPDNYDPDGLSSFNPRPDKLMSKSTALKLQTTKAQLLYQRFEKSKKINDLEMAYLTFLAASDLIKNLRQGILTVESKQALAEKNVVVYEGAIKTAYELFQQTNDKQYQLAAFELTESNKAQLLLESFNEQSAKKIAGIPDSVLQLEKNLQLELAYLQNHRIEIQRKGTISDKEDAKIADLLQQLDRLTTSFEKKYPRYFDLKYNTQLASIETIQQSLKNTSKAILEYFVGENNIYLFVITSENYHFQQLENESQIRQNVETLRQMLCRAPAANFDLAAFQRLVKTSSDLYQQLVQPAIGLLSPGTSDLMIVLDYYLNYIPFDLLLSQAPAANNGSFSLKNMSYLLEDYNISYDYSVTLNAKNQNREKRDFKSDFIGYAPAFKDVGEVATRACTANDLYSLQCSKNEIESINDLLNGEGVIGVKASLATFKQSATDYKIIHMATHACIDENNASYNKIFLTDGYLSNFDLYNMGLDADMAVLSACNTGSGELVKGEGVLSLARGFFNAGCKSTIMSMWSVDDCATSDIMIYFYEGLKEGMPKDQALRQAKIKYLEQVDKPKMHPYYWTAFVPFGDMEVIEFGGGTKPLFYILSVALLLGLFVFFKFKKYKS